MSTGRVVPRLMSLATAVPAHQVDQSSAAEFARGFFASDFPELDRYLGVFARAGIERRRLVQPLEWYSEPHGFADKNAVWHAGAMRLAREAASKALERSGGAQPGAIVFCTSTGVATPSLCAELVPALDLPRDIQRYPLWGLGCAAGAAGLARAASIARALEAPVLLVCVELCSLTFVHEDRSRSNLVATALFGDGAAAAVVGPSEQGAELLGHHAHLIDESVDVMGWDVVPSGFAVRFARSIPGIVESLADEIVAGAAASAQAEAADIEHLVVHPGGRKVLEAWERKLALESGELAPSWDVLRDYGNMSGPTVLFCLERMLESTPPTEGLGVVVGMGPGFSAETVSFRW